MNLFENVLHALFDDIPMLKDVKISGKTMTAKIEPNLRVKVQFISTNCQNQYDALLLTLDGREISYAHMCSVRFGEITGNMQHPVWGPVAPAILTRKGDEKWNVPISERGLKLICAKFSEYFEFAQKDIQHLMQDSAKQEFYESELYQMFGHHPNLSMQRYYDCELRAKTAAGYGVTIEVVSMEYDDCYDALHVRLENPKGGELPHLFFPFSDFMGDKQHREPLFIDGKLDFPQWNKHFPLKKKLAMANSVIECVLKNQRAELV